MIQGQSPKQSTSAQTGPETASGASASTGAKQKGHAKKGSGVSAKERRQARRDLERELRVAARHRRRVAAESYFANPPKSDDIWICELCEYERIFGEPPKALIRTYEMKARKQRQEELDRKRLLEKAKAKSRKAKKSGKAPATAKGGRASSQAQAGPLGEGEAASNDPGATQSEGEYDDEYLHATIDDIGGPRWACACHCEHHGPGIG